MASTEPNDARARARRDRSGIIPRDRETFDPAAANAQMVETLRLTGLRRRARAGGLVLRHSDYGYSLINRAGDRVGGRSDLTLDNVEAHLDGPRGR
jgi:hypothetical protein